MIYGDDDTIWHLSNVLKLLEPFDHSLPYALSDFLLWPDAMGPSVLAPRCLPCHWDNKINVSFGFDWPSRGGCEKGCTPDLACGPRTYEIDSRFPAMGLINGSSIPKSNEECLARGITGHCPKECSKNAGEGPLVGYGGAGYILSVGLLKQFPPERVRRHYDTHQCNGCDCFISRMLWNAPHAFTDPGYGFLTLQNPNDIMRRRLFSDGRFDHVIKSPSRCHEEPDCIWYLQVTVSQHLNARHFTHTHKDHPLHWIEVAANWTRHVLLTLDLMRVDLQARGLLNVKA